MMILDLYPLPEDIVTLGVEGILQIWRSKKVRGAGERKARKLYEAARNSIGRKEAASIARIEFKSIKEDLDRYQERLDEIEKKADEILPKIKNGKS